MPDSTTEKRETKRRKEDADAGVSATVDSKPAASSSTNPSSLFTCSDDEFQTWIASQLAQNYPSLQESYPDLFDKAPVCFVKWRQRFADNPPLWKRLFDKDRVLKEFAEAVPVLDAVLTLIEQADLLNTNNGGPQEQQQYTIIDLCSGKGYLSMLLSEMLPPDKVFRIVLMDKAFAMRNQKQPGPKHINWEHIYGEKKQMDKAAGGEDLSSTSGDNGDTATKPQSYYDTWPISLDTSKQDLKASRQLNNIPKHYFSKEHPAIILAIHLCGTLSMRAIDLYNNHPDTVHFLALKPCCLPGMVHAKRHEIFKIGTHQFDSSEVCIHGKWKQNKWIGGPPRSHIQQKFQVWARHLYCGIVVASANESDSSANEDAETLNTKVLPLQDSLNKRADQKKLHCRINVQTEGGFQNDFLFAQRTPTTKAMWERLQPYQVAQAESKEET